MSSNRGDLTGEDVPRNYPELEKKLKDLKWINAVIKQMEVLSEGNEVVEAILTPFGPSAGFYSELGKITVKFKDPNDPLSPPSDCIVKFLPQGFEKRLILDLVNLPRSEVLSYFYILRHETKYSRPPSAIPTPKMLYADYCSRTNNALMIMERITDVLGDQGKEGDIDQARAQMICMAKFHASHWGATHPKKDVLMNTESPVTPILGLKMKMNTKALFKMLKEVRGEGGGKKITYVVHFAPALQEKDSPFAPRSSTNP